jgi:dTDP-glucose 4,6-dehydratase
MTLPPEDLTHVLNNVSIWEKLRGQRIFLTGSSGFVGTWLRESFEWANTALRLEAQLVSVRRDCLPIGEFHLGIHAARADSFWADMAVTKRVLDFSVERGVGRILFTSSGAGYGKLPALMSHVPEDFTGAPYPHDPGTGYAQAKRMNEFLCAEYAEQCGLCAIIARLFAFTGPLLPLDANFAVGNFVRDVIAGGPVVIQGDGNGRRSYLYAADLAVWLWTLLLDGRNAHPYNVGSQEAISIRDLAAAVVSNTRPGTEIVVKGGERGSDYVPCVERARMELGLRPLIPLDEAIRRMYAWNVRNGESGEHYFIR